MTLLKLGNKVQVTNEIYDIEIMEGIVVGIEYEHKIGLYYVVKFGDIIVKPFKREELVLISES